MKSTRAASRRMSLVWMMCPLSRWISGAQTHVTQREAHRTGRGRRRRERSRLDSLIPA